MVVKGGGRSRVIKLCTIRCRAHKRSLVHDEDTLGSYETVTLAAIDNLVGCISGSELKKHYSSIGVNKVFEQIQISIYTSFFLSRVIILHLSGIKSSLQTTVLQKPKEHLHVSYYFLGHAFGIGLHNPAKLVCLVVDDAE